MNNTYPELLREIEEIVWGTESDIAKVHAIQGLLYTWDQMQDNKTDQLFDWDKDPDPGAFDPDAVGCIEEDAPVTFRKATKDDIVYSDDYTPGLDHSVLK